MNPVVREQLDALGTLERNLLDSNCPSWARAINKVRAQLEQAILASLTYLPTSAPADESGAKDGASFDFCWLVELFLPYGGNSLGHYHTGFTHIDGASRTTQSPHEAKRYASYKDANYAASKLDSKQGEWRAVEHGFERGQRTTQPKAAALEVVRNEAFNLADTVIEFMQCGREHEARTQPAGDLEDAAIVSAARDVCFFYWSENDEDAVAAINSLRNELSAIDAARRARGESRATRNSGACGP